jgi:hypothetical protein
MKTLLYNGWEFQKIKGSIIMNEEDRIEELKRHLEFVRSIYSVAGDWGDVPYGRLNALVEYFEEELKQLDSQYAT